MRTRMIIDLSSLCWTNLLKGKDHEFGKWVQHEGREVFVNSPQYGYEKALDFLITAMDRFDVTPYDMIFVMEGAMSKAIRQAMCPEYKGGRESRPPEAYEAFNSMKHMLCAAFKSVGATVMTQDGVEADDIIAYLCERLQGDKLIVSNDNDLCRLLSPTVYQYRMGDLLRAGDNPKGPFPARFITLEKALVGGHDNLKGAIGFGEKFWLDFLVWAGDDKVVDALEDLVRTKKLHELEDDVGSFKPFRKIIDSAQSVYQGYAASQFYPNLVNTLRQPLRIQAGMTKPMDQVPEERLRRWGQKVKLITADNYGQALDFFKSRLEETKEFALDIEASTPDESDEWLAAGNREDKLDVFAYVLTSCSITFGSNGQFTYYFSVDHADTKNISSEQLRQLVALIPKDKVNLVQNAGFELSVLYTEWAAKQRDNGWHGFLPNVRDTKVYASYVDENLRLGLKERSKHHLGYEQISYDQITKLRGYRDELPAGGLTLDEEMEPVVMSYGDDGEPVYATDETGGILQRPTGIVTKQYKMNELSGQHVLPYGADDTICTYALAQHYRIVMELERTWDLCEEIETYPAYLTALGFLSGTEFDLAQMLEQEAEDDAEAGRAWGVLRTFLIEKGWEGTVCPQIMLDRPAEPGIESLHKPENWWRDWSAKTIKEFTEIILGTPLVTLVRTPAKLGRLIAEMDHDDAPLLGKYVEDANIDQINDWVKRRFDGEPKLDMDSPKVMRNFLYKFLGLPIRLINPPTDTERKKAKIRPSFNATDKEKAEHDRCSALLEASYRFNKIRAGSESEPPMTDKERLVLFDKATTDDTAIEFALFFDVPDHPALKAIQTLKTIGTRKKLFYGPYKHFRHWKDNKIHASANQCQAVTRRWSFSDPNLTQLPKRGEGVKFRRNFKPHHKDAVVVSVDFNSQELRLQAGLSRDPEMLSCYLGDRPRDIHCITASGALKVVWSASEIAKAVAAVGNDFDNDYDFFMALYKGGDAVLAKKAKDLRALSKNVNFGSAYGCAAPKMQELLVCEFEVAKTMLDAKLALFSRFEEWKQEVEEQALRDGFIRTELGGIRHLQEVIRNGEKWQMRGAARQASNFKIQSAGAELAKKALTRLWLSGVFFKLDAVFFAVIHDEVVASVHKDHAVEFIKVLHDAISQPYTPDFPVPFIGSISLGPNLGDQVELGETVDEELIEATLAQMFSPVTVDGVTSRFVDWTNKLRMNYNVVLDHIGRGTSIESQVRSAMEKRAVAVA